MRRSWILPCLGSIVAWACAAPIHAQPDPAPADEAREARLVEVQNSFSGPTGGIRIIDAASGPKGTFRLALNTEFFLIGDYFVPTDRAQHFAGNLSLSVTPTEFLEVFASAEVTSAWDDSNDPMLIQRVADVNIGGNMLRENTIGLDADSEFQAVVGHARTNGISPAHARAIDFGPHRQMLSLGITKLVTQLVGDSQAEFDGVIAFRLFGGHDGLMKGTQLFSLAALQAFEIFERLKTVDTLVCRLARRRSEFADPRRVDAVAAWARYR